MAVIRQFSNSAVITSLAGDMTASQLTMIVNSTSGYPVATADRPFTVKINPGEATEEILDIIGGAGTAGNPWIIGTENVSGVDVRAKDGSISRAWANGTTVVHGFSARDFREAQEAVANAQGLISSAMPLGGIIMWSGALSAIPTGFKLCNGQSYDTVTGAPVTDGTAGSIKTPDLTGRFIIGAGGTHSGAKSVKDTGGAPVANWAGSVSLTAANMPAVSHTHGMVASGAHKHFLKNRAAGAVNNGAYNVPTTSSTAATDDYFGDSASNGGHDHPIASTTTGFATPTPVTVSPPWYALAYIQKIVG